MILVTMIEEALGTLPSNAKFLLGLFGFGVFVLFPGQVIATLLLILFFSMVSSYVYKCFNLMSPFMIDQKEVK